MGRRSRKRGATTPSVASDAAWSPPRAPRPRAHLSEAPKAPWSPFPLVELSVLLGLVLIALGVADVGGRRVLLLAGGLVLVTLAGIELALREHLAGFRSHSTLLAAAAALAVVVPLSLLASPGKVVLLAVGVVVFGAVFAGGRAVFRARSGGLGFRA
jgi:hypothetical protein